MGGDDKPVISPNNVVDRECNDHINNHSTSIYPLSCIYLNHVCKIRVDILFICMPYVVSIRELIQQIMNAMVLV